MAEQVPLSPFSRRALLRAGGGLAATTALLGTGAVFAGPASAAVPASKRFDLTQPSYDEFRSKILHESHHVMQGFAFDNQNVRIFIVNARNGGTGDDLCVTQVNFSGEIQGSMHLNNAGHGVSIGVEPVGTDSYIWMECDSDGPTGTGRGTALARFKFVNGGTPSVKKFLTGSKTITCATDPINKRIAVRRNEGGKMFYSVYPLASAAAGNFSSPLAHFAQPALSTEKVTFQGYTIYGQYLYTLDGEGHADPADINSYVTCIDMNTGTVKSRALTRAGKSLVFREPEGLGIYRSLAGETRLYMGFGSRSSMENINRYANLFYKNVLID
ncbi:teichoic acid biosynthesis protein C [Amycolatopsis sp. WAC 04182]|uniref:phage baseplate protein n=1 Tax=Amycolatopsis sp. WAC 04182 TaxID=2203198 RepID=UPI000F78702B|nr:teichoic acid biosynthesis protein C [Amycolatopsis sp. WAC 04182]RSN66009.1 teichoic acid biosynthesis protein C [Amycolatopsis sp. WAC 04182]